MFWFGLAWWIQTHLMPALGRLPKLPLPIDLTPYLPTLPMQRNQQPGQPASRFGARLFLWRKHDRQT